MSARQHFATEVTQRSQQAPGSCRVMPPSIAAFLLPQSDTTSLPSLPWALSLSLSPCPLFLPNPQRAETIPNSFPPGVGQWAIHPLTGLREPSEEGGRLSRRLSFPWGWGGRDPRGEGILEAPESGGQGSARPLVVRRLRSIRHGDRFLCKALPGPECPAIMPYDTPPSRCLKPLGSLGWGRLSSASLGDQQPWTLFVLCLCCPPGESAPVAPL